MESAPETGDSGLFEGIFRTAIDGIVAIDESGIVQSFNPAAERLFGYTSEEVVGKNVSMLMPSPDRDRHDTYVANYRNTGHAKIIGSGREVVALHKTGKRVPIHLAISEAFVGSVRLFVGICRDITELVNARAEIESERLRNSALLDTAADGIITISAVGIIESFNRAAETLFGYPKNEVVGKNVKMLMPGSVAEHHDGYLSHTLRTGERKIIGIGREVLARRKNGTTFPAWLSVSHFRVHDADYFTGILRDVTDLRQKEHELGAVNQELSRNAWIAEQQLALNNAVRKEPRITIAFQSVLELVGAQSGATAGIGYWIDDSKDGAFRVAAGFAFPSDRRPGILLHVGEGLLGEAIRTAKFRLVSLSGYRFEITSGLGVAMPSHVAFVPLAFQGRVMAAFELAFVGPPDEKVVEYLETLCGVAGTILGAAHDQHRISDLLQQSQAQGEELRSANEQLDQRAQQLLAQQEEMEATNEQLAEQKARLELANEALERARSEVEDKAQVLEKTSRYKSEFLANMSHELRTPLNSVLILAKVLGENRTDNLTDDQLECLKVIAGSGTDLLNLVNDILDLSKIEAGKLTFDAEDVNVDSVLTDLERQFAPLMSAKSLSFTVVKQGELPATLRTDKLRLEQVLRNLLSNANKFTEVGAVSLQVRRFVPNGSTARESLSTQPALVFEVVDTGIGIPTNKQELVFQAFQQADTTLSRKFGGTGLGLSISSSLAEQLGGEIQLESEDGRGSTFRLILPLKHDFVVALSKTQPVGATPVVVRAAVQEAVPMASIQPTVLLVEDDPASQLALRRLIESRGVGVEVRSSPAEALAACRNQSFKGVILDLGLNAGSGWDFLQGLKDEGIANVPIVVHTGRELSEEEERQLLINSRAVIIKGERAAERLIDEVKLLLHDAPRKTTIQPGLHRDAMFIGKRVLVVDDDLRNVFALRALLSGSGMQILVAENGLEAIAQFEKNPDLDVILMDIMMPKMDGYEATRRIRRLPRGMQVTIIALTAKAMKEDRQLCLDSGASDYLTKPINNDALFGLLRVWMSR